MHSISEVVNTCTLKVKVPGEMDGRPGWRLTRAPDHRGPLCHDGCDEASWLEEAFQKCADEATLGKSNIFENR